MTAISSRGKTGGWNEVNVGTIFEGSIKYVRTGHETKVDSCVELIAADGGAGYNFAIVSTTLAAPFLGSLLALLSSEEIVEARRMLPDVVP